MGVPLPFYSSAVARLFFPFLSFGLGEVEWRRREGGKMEERWRGGGSDVSGEDEGGREIFIVIVR